MAAQKSLKTLDFKINIGYCVGADEFRQKKIDFLTILPYKMLLIVHLLCVQRGQKKIRAVFLFSVIPVKQ